MKEILSIIAVLIACGFLYQSYDSFRSVITGTQPKASKANDDPKSASARGAGIAWGLCSAFIALITFWTVLFRH